MDKIATPSHLMEELRRIQAYAGTSKPSRVVIANELRGLAKRVGGDLYPEYIVFKVPSGRIFHKTDWDIDTFVNAATSIVKKVRGTLVHNYMKAGFFEVMWQMPLNPAVPVKTNEIIDKIEKLPEYTIPKEYGARITVE